MSFAPSITANPVTDFNELTTYPFMVNALEAGTVVAVMAGVVGWFMVLRRESFAGHTLSVMAFPGAAFALLVGLPATVGYFAFCGLAALAIGIGARGGAPRAGGQASAITGAVQALGLACGFLFLSLYQGVLANYETILFGTFLGITQAQVLLLVIVAFLTLASLAVLGRPLFFASVDEGVARARGVPAAILAVVFLLILGMAVASTAQVTGALLVFALLVAPPATAQVLTARIGVSLVLSVVIGVVITWLGLALAYFYGYPSSFYIATLGFAAYLIARIVRGVAAGRGSAGLGRAWARAGV